MQRRNALQRSPLCIFWPTLRCRMPPHANSADYDLLNLGRRAVFTGREKELAILEKAYASDTFQMVVMYGRRRVGKTSILQKFAKDKPDAIFSPAAKQAPKKTLSPLAEASRIPACISSTKMPRARFSRISKTPCRTFSQASNIRVKRCLSSTNTPTSPKASQAYRPYSNRSSITGRTIQTLCSCSAGRP